MRRTQLLTALRDCRGVTTIEAALLLPVVAVLLVGLLDLGIYVHREMDLTNAARIGAQFAFQDSSATSTMASTAISALGPRPASDPTPTASASTTCECPTSVSDYTLTSTVSCSTSSCPLTATKPATYVTVSIQQAYTPIMGSWGLVRSRTMTGTATLRVN